MWDCLNGGVFLSCARVNFTPNRMKNIVWHNLRSTDKGKRAGKGNHLEILRFAMNQRPMLYYSVLFLWLYSSPHHFNSEYGSVSYSMSYSILYSVNMLVTKLSLVINKILDISRLRARQDGIWFAKPTLFLTSVLMERVCFVELPSRTVWHQTWRKMCH